MNRSQVFHLTVDDNGIVHIDVELIRWLLRTRGIKSKKRRIVKKTVKRFLHTAIKDHVKGQTHADI